MEKMALSENDAILAAEREIERQARIAAEMSATRELEKLEAAKARSEEVAMTIPESQEAVITVDASSVTESEGIDSNAPVTDLPEREP